MYSVRVFLTLAEGERIHAGRSGLFSMTSISGRPRRELGDDGAIAHRQASGRQTIAKKMSANANKARPAHTLSRSAVSRSAGVIFAHRSAASRRRRARPIIIAHAPGCEIPLGCEASSAAAARD
jgi:hypothetical protein